MPDRFPRVGWLKTVGYAAAKNSTGPSFSMCGSTNNPVEKIPATIKVRGLFFVKPIRETH